MSKKQAKSLIDELHKEMQTEKAIEELDSLNSEIEILLEESKQRSETLKQKRQKKALEKCFTKLADTDIIECRRFGSFSMVECDERFDDENNDCYECKRGN